MDASRDTWTIAEVADFLGYTGKSATGSARKQLSRWGIAANGRQPGRGGMNCYSADKVKVAYARRLGQGHRSDLKDLARVEGITGR